MFPLTGAERARQDIAETFAQYNLSENMMKMRALDVLPLRNVPLAHGTYPVIPVKELMKNPGNEAAAKEGYAAARAPRSAYLRDDLGFTQEAYTTEEHGLEGVVDENEAMHYASHFQHEAITAQRELHRLMVQRELRTARACFDVTRFLPTAAGTYTGQSQPAGTYREVEADNFTGAAATGVPWSDFATSNPIQDVFVSKTKVFQKYGIYPDCMVINELTWRFLRRNEIMRQQWMALGAGQQATQQDLTLSAVQQVLDIDEIVVCGAVRDRNNAQTADVQFEHIWGDGALITKKIRGGDIREIGLGHTLHWTPDGSRNPAFVEDYREVQTRTQVVRVRHQDRQLIKYPIAEFITNTIAP